MKVAVTYEKETGNIFQHFGKTQYFKIYQIEDGKILSSEVIDNGGNGHHAIPPYLKSLRVETLILGNRGQGAIEAIAVSGLKMIKNVDLEDNRNLFVVSVILIAGIGGLVLNFGGIKITSIATALILGILVNIILSGGKKNKKNAGEVDENN